MSGYNFSNGSVGPGFNWWQQIGGGNTDIELNAGAGVTGINAVMPADNNLHLFLTALAGTKFGAFGATDLVNNFLYLTGVAATGNPAQPYTSAMIMIDQTTGETLEFTFDQTSKSARMNYNVAGVTKSFLSLNSGILEYFDRVANRVVFAVKLNGNILTNQIQAGAPLAALPTFKIPFYDPTGAFICFVPGYLT